MNLIKKLGAEIDKANVLLDEYNSIIADDPDNLAYQLSIETIKEHIADLQAQIKEEKDFREKEVIELRLKGPLVEEGSIPLSILGDIAKELSNAIYSASQLIKAGKEVMRMIPRSTIKTLNLRFAGIKSGSTRILITGDTSPDIFGHSLIEESLTNTFELLGSETPDEITDSASKIGIRSVASINKFLKTLSSSQLEAEMSWTSPSDIGYKWKGSKAKLTTMSNTLEKIKSPKPEQINVIGKLIMISLKWQFEVQDEKGVSYKGTYPSQLLEEIKTLHVGDQLTSVIEKKIIINEATGKQKNYYTLLSLKVLDKT